MSAGRGGETFSVNFEGQEATICAATQEGICRGLEALVQRGYISRHEADRIQEGALPYREEM